uniref:Opr5 n=1 Tax=Arundo donax TaxID=35708 RepID=A0A0A9TWU7_ARUDO
MHPLAPVSRRQECLCTLERCLTLQWPQKSKGLL